MDSADDAARTTDDSGPTAHGNNAATDWSAMEHHLRATSRSSHDEPGGDRKALAELVSFTNFAESRLFGQFPADENLNLVRILVSDAIDALRNAAVATLIRSLRGAPDVGHLTAAAADLAAVEAFALSRLAGRCGILGQLDLTMLLACAHLAAGATPDLSDLD